MTDSAKPEWPPYYWQLPRNDVFTLGVIGLNYGRLERIFREMFSHATGMTVEQTAATFHRVANNVRIQIIEDLTGERKFPPEYQNAIDDFCGAFFKCAENRNAIMHSFAPGTHTSRSTGAKGILLVKYSKAGNAVGHPATLTELRRIADEMHDWCSYGGDLNSRLRIFLELRAGGHDAIVLAPLPHKPNEPAEMSWQILQTDPTAPLPP